MYGYRLHQRLMAQTRIGFSISLQGRNVDMEATAQLDGKPVENGQRISLGRHTFIVTEPKAKTFSTNFFAWYGEHDFGEIHLQRMMGHLKISASPAAETITVTGPEFSTTCHDVTATNLTVPTDAYTIHAEYAHWSQTRKTVVAADATEFCTFAPQLGAIHIVCNKDTATYRMENTDDKQMGDGSMPTTVTDLPIGSYTVTVAYHQRQMQKSVQVKAGKTNELSVQFSLGAVQIESAPTGAQVSNADGHFLGRTPLELDDLPTQPTQFKLSLPGYEPASVDLEIVANQTNTWSTNLVSVRYVSAMAVARQVEAASNYYGLAHAAEVALEAKPGDAAALSLKKIADTQLAAQHERTAQLKRPRQAFDTLCEDTADSSLFTEHELTTTKPAKDVAKAIVAALKASPNAFKITYDESSLPKTYVITAQQKFSLGILGGSERDCLLVVGQAKPGETQIYFKVLEYQVQSTIRVTGLFSAHDDKKLVPLNASRIQMTEAMRERVQDGQRLVINKIRHAESDE